MKRNTGYGSSAAYRLRERKNAREPIGGPVAFVFLVADFDGDDDQEVQTASALPCFCHSGSAIAPIFEPEDSFRFWSVHLGTAS